MAITFSAAYQAEMKSPNRIPDIIITLALTGKTIKWGTSKHSDVLPCLESSDSFQSEIDPKNGLSTMGSIKFTIKGSDNFLSIISGYHFKNRRVTKEEGFISNNFLRANYVETFSGVISDYKRNGETLTIIVADEMELLRKKAPTTTTGNTQFIDYSDSNPVDTMIDMIGTQAGVSGSRYNSAGFISERDLWYNGWKFQRVIVKTTEIKKYLAELQEETNSFIFHNGEKIDFKAFAPLPPGSVPKEFSDEYNLLQLRTSHSSGYKDFFFNKVELHYDYNESGDDKLESFENRVIEENTDSTTDMGETKTKIIKSKWIKSLTFTQPSNITGVTIYHLSYGNGISAGKTGHTVAFDNTAETLTWTAPDGTTGDAVEIKEDGQYQVFDQQLKKYIRVVVDYSALPGSNQSDAITITALSGSAYASIIAKRFLNRFAYPIPEIKGEVDMKDINNGGEMYKLVDTVNITSEKVSYFGVSELSAEPCMLLGISPDPSKQRFSFVAMPTKLNKRFGYIQPTSGAVDYRYASEFKRQYAFIGRTSDNKVYDGSVYVDGYYIF
jgi:hypothetical protein